MYFALLLFCAIPAFPQQPTATLTGNLTDPNGAVVTGASVTVTNSATNLSRTTTTNENGIYIFPDLPVGSYDIAIHASGFTRTKIINVDLTVGQKITRDRQLEVITLDEIITIDDTYGTQLVDTQTSKVDAVINDKEIENLPLNGRNFLELALLTPGNTLAPNFDPTKTNTVVISSAGQIGRGGNVMIDGTDNNDDVVGGSLLNISQDAVQEFQVATNRF